MFDFHDEEALGKVVAVDTDTITVLGMNADKVGNLQVNQLALIYAAPGHPLIGIVRKIARKLDDNDLPDKSDAIRDLFADEAIYISVSLIGTLHHRREGKKHVFRRSIASIPRMDTLCFVLDGPNLSRFMRSISQAQDGNIAALSMGTYALDGAAEAMLDGNRFFQRHAAVVGSTGSGKSWTTARILEQVAALSNANALVFDIHGEYQTLTGPGFRHLRVAGPGDFYDGEVHPDVLYLPFWLLNYQALRILLVERSDQNAPNQAMLIGRLIREAKVDFLSKSDRIGLADNITVDSPIPFDMEWILERLNHYNREIEEGARRGTTRAAEFNNKLGRLIARIEAKNEDLRLDFLFPANKPETQQLDYLDKLAGRLMAGSAAGEDKGGGVKIIDFSEVPSDILPLIIAMVAGLAFSIQQWTPSDKRHPVALFCDEAHNYIPDSAQEDSEARVAVRTFERLAKEGRKYGVGLVIISQRPAEVSRTVISQCNNVIAMRLTNAEDQARVRGLLPDTLAGFADLLPVLDTGEAVVVGDASLLPSRIRIAEPRRKPDSRTVEFWNKWSNVDDSTVLGEACEAWRRQSLRAAAPPNDNGGRGA
jgi:uncharacterized protein